MQMFTSAESGTGRTVRFRKIALHPGPHLEEIFALWLLRTFGEERYPGVRTASIEFWPKGAETADGRPVGTHEAEGTLVLGTALSRLDDHRVRLGAPGVITCSAQLVAEALGVDDDPALTPTLGYLSKIDSQGKASVFDLWTIVKLLQDPELGVMPADPRQLIYWCFRAFKALHRDQQRFHGETLKRWRELAKVWVVPYRKTALRIGEVHTDDQAMHRVARFHGRCDVVIVHGTRQGNYGNTQVYVRQRIRVPDRLVEGIQHRYHDAFAEPIGKIVDVLRALEPRGLPAIARSNRWPEELRQVAEVFCQSEARPPVFWVTSDIGRILRGAELTRRRVDYRRDDPRLWGRQTIGMVSQFYVLPEPGWVFNGSESAPEVPASLIPTTPKHPQDPSDWVKLVSFALIPRWAEAAGIRLERSTPVPQVAGAGTEGGDGNEGNGDAAGDPEGSSS